MSPPTLLPPETEPPRTAQRRICPDVQPARAPTLVLLGARISTSTSVRSWMSAAQYPKRLAVAVEVAHERHRGRAERLERLLESRQIDVCRELVVDLPSPVAAIHAHLPEMFRGGDQVRVRRGPAAAAVAAPGQRTQHPQYADRPQSATLHRSVHCLSFHVFRPPRGRCGRGHRLATPESFPYPRRSCPARPRPL
jgi:hypothetical protein